MKAGDTVTVLISTHAGIDKGATGVIESEKEDGFAVLFESVRVQQYTGKEKLEPATVFFKREQISL